MFDREINLKLQLNSSCDRANRLVDEKYKNIRKYPRFDAKMCDQRLNKRGKWVRAGCQLGYFCTKYKFADGPCFLARLTTQGSKSEINFVFIYHFVCIKTFFDRP